MIISRPVGHYSNLPTVEIDILKASVFFRNYFGSILCAHIVGRDRAFATARVHPHSHKIENRYTYIWDLAWKVGNIDLTKATIVIRSNIGLQLQLANYHRVPKDSFFKVLVRFLFEPFYKLRQPVRTRPQV